ncbi:hypothetical protein BJ165DRAFT_298116 [Panaeolus papilionaceus]|nr:hypothetical protein BJ165DRAFT_298116 [Panaeolus papilionaceus]
MGLTPRQARNQLQKMYVIDLSSVVCSLSYCRLALYCSQPHRTLSDVDEQAEAADLRASTPEFIPPPLVNSSAGNPGAFTDDPDSLPQPTLTQDPWGNTIHKFQRSPAIDVVPFSGMNYPDDNCDEFLSQGRPLIYLLIGPIGSGKSAFVECLAGGRTALRISGDGLEGTTKELTAYLLHDVIDKESGRPIVLLDTPGFMNPDVSECSIMKQVFEWKKQFLK